LIILVIVFSVVGTLCRSAIIFFTVERIEKEPNYELPKSILLVLLKELFALSYSRYLLWKGHGIVYFVIVIVTVVEDVYRGLFKLLTHRLPSIAIFKYCVTEDTQEAHEIVLVHYILRKQAQFTITISFYIYSILIYTYWNATHFGTDVANQNNFTTICYIIPISLVIDLVCCISTLYYASHMMERKYNILKLVERLYSYPQVRTFIILSTIAVMQILFITMFDVTWIAPDY